MVGSGGGFDVCWGGGAVGAESGGSVGDAVFVEVESWGFWLVFKFYFCCLRGLGER